ncbi:MAG: NAD(P)-binding protein [Clostridiaceae bacterium]|nr:NAD(P)-binding protein [Clostridiaceae bacterium]
MPETGLFDVAIIGGGAAGLFLCSYLRETDLRVILFEQQEILGRKLTATGNGRGNLSAVEVNADHYFYDRNDPAARGIIEKVLAGLTPNDLQRRMADLGLACTAIDGRIYPLSLQALSLQLTLRDAAFSTNIVIEQPARIVKLQAPQPGCTGYTLRTDSGASYSATCVVIAIGGPADPNLSGWQNLAELWESAGLRMGRPFAPALARLKLANPARRLAGTRVQAAVSVYDRPLDGKIIYAETGEILFTEYGLSGIPILNVAGAISPYMTQYQPELRLNFWPKRPERELEKLLHSEYVHRAERPLTEAFAGILPEKLRQYLCTLALTTVAPDKLRRKETEDEKATKWEILSRIKLGELLPDFIDEVRRLILGLTCPIIAVTDMATAQTAIGGLKLGQFSASLEAKTGSGLFVCGELLDVTGLCGGYNLHWAFASATAVARGIRRFFPDRGMREEAGIA